MSRLFTHRSHDLPVTLFFCTLHPTFPSPSPQIDLMPHDVITQLLRVLAIETKQEKAIINADTTDMALTGLEAFSFDYIVKWPLSLIINRFREDIIQSGKICHDVCFYRNLNTILSTVCNFFIFSRKALTRYQMLFRHMFYCKHVERLLCNVWISNKEFKEHSLHSAKW